MKNKNLFRAGLIFSLSAILSCGVIAGLSLKDKAVDEVKATDISVLYLKPSIWHSQNPWYAAYFYGSGLAEKWSKMTEVSGAETTTYKVDVPSGYSQVIFTRNDPNKTTLGWDSKWNQTEDLTITDKDCFTVTDWGNEKSTGNWSNYADVYTYSINGNAAVTMVDNGTSEVKSSSTVTVSKGDIITFTKNGTEFTVDPKDDNQLTKVYLNSENKLVAAEGFEEVLYLNYSSNKLWAGQFTPEVYYAIGSFNNWNGKTGTKATAVEGETGVYKVSLTVEDGATLKFVKTPTSGNELTYYSADSTKISTQSEVAMSVDGNTNLVLTNAGTYDIYYNTNTSWYSVENPSWTNPYSVKIGETTYPLILNSGTEYKTEDIDLKSGSEIAIVKDGTEVDGYSSKAIYNNNIDENKKVMANATSVIYVDISAKTVFSDIKATSGYHMLKNGEIVNLTQNGTDSSEWYTAALTFTTGDTIRFIDVKSSGTDRTVVFDATTMNEYSQVKTFEFTAGTGWVATADSTTAVYLQLNSEGNAIYFGSVSEELARAKTFASDFYTAIREICQEDGSTDKTSLGNAWKTQKETFDELPTEVQTILKEATTSHSVSEIAQFISLYEIVLARYGEETLGTGYDFLEKNITSSRNITINSFGTNVGTGMIAIIVVTILGLTAIGSVVFIKSRKHS